MELKGGSDFEEYRSAFSKEKEQEAAQEQGEDATLVLSWPDGTQKTHTFKLGATVAYVKAVLEEAHGVPIGTIVLTLADRPGKPLIDPLSLCDCAGIKPGNTAVIVTFKDA